MKQIAFVLLTVFYFITFILFAVTKDNFYGLLTVLFAINFFGSLILDSRK